MARPDEDQPDSHSASPDPAAARVVVRVVGVLKVVIFLFRFMGYVFDM
jgi:hypothetical protein